MSDEDNQDIDLPNDADQGSDNTQDDKSNDTSADDDDGEQGSGDSDESGESDAGSDTDTVDELKEKLHKTEEQNSRLFARVQESKGLKFDKAANKWVPKGTQVQKPSQSSSKKDNLTSEELYTLIEAKVPKEDISIVQEYARMNKITIEESLSKPLVKGLLSERLEQRQTSNATNTGPSRRGSNKQSTESLVRNAEEKGELPEDQSDIESIVEARIQKRIGNK